MSNGLRGRELRVNHGGRPARIGPAWLLLLHMPGTNLVISNMLTCFLPLNTAF